MDVEWRSIEFIPVTDWYGTPSRLSTILFSVTIRVTVLVPARSRTVPSASCANAGDARLHAGCAQTVAVRRAVRRFHSIPARLPLRQYASTGFGSASTSAPNASTSASPIRSRSTGR